MSLTNPRFASNQRLQQAARNAPSIRRGERDGVAVAILQRALVDYGLPMPRSTRPDGSMDGVFGSETEEMVQRFQERNALLDHLGRADGIVGQQTMTAMDRLVPQASATTTAPSGRDNRIYDAINLFKYSRVGQGTADIEGDHEYQAGYRRLAAEVLRELWRLWSLDEIGFAHLEGAVGNSQRGRSGPDILVNNRIEPSNNPTTYATEAEQGKLAATSCNLVHEATHLLRDLPLLQEEVLCETIQQYYFRELRVGRSHTSRVTGTRLTARFGQNVPYYSMYVSRDVRLTSKDLVDYVFNVDRVRMPQLELAKTAAFIARSLGWWGGLGARWPSTCGYYLRSLAAQDRDYAEPILQILESLDPTRWPAARSCAGDIERVRRGLRLTQHGGTAVRVGGHLSYNNRFSDRVARVQRWLGEPFGV